MSTSDPIYAVCDREFGERCKTKEMASSAKKASEVVSMLDLKPHAEGGFYLETFRDSSVTLSRSQLPSQCKQTHQNLHLSPFPHIIRKKKKFLYIKVVCSYKHLDLGFLCSL